MWHRSEGSNKDTNRTRQKEGRATQFQYLAADTDCLLTGRSAKLFAEIVSPKVIMAIVSLSHQNISNVPDI